MSVNFSTLQGQTLANIKTSEDEITFTTTEGKRYKLFHSQDCCESVTIEDICGDLADLIGEPLLIAEEVIYNVEKDLPTEERVRLQIERANKSYYHADSETWTFYKLSTRRGSVTIRWYGESNGYYSESVDFEELDEQ